MGLAEGIQNEVVHAALSSTGISDFSNNLFDPRVELSKPAPSSDAFAEYALTNYFFRLMILAPSDKDIQSIDDFFESFGYNVGLFKVPNLKVRGTFTYVKTRDAQVTSNVKMAAEQMAALLNNGCKFWVGEIGK